MNNSKIIAKVATFFGAVSAIFTVILAILTYLLIKIVNASASPPVDYVALSILSNVFPYLFLAVTSLVIAYVLRGVGKENLEKEALPPAQPAE